jgi:hypothetical protein
VIGARVLGQHDERALAQMERSMRVDSVTSGMLCADECRIMPCGTKSLVGRVYHYQFICPVIPMASPTRNIPTPAKGSKIKLKTDAPGVDPATLVSTRPNLKFQSQSF